MRPQKGSSTEQITTLASFMLCPSHSFIMAEQRFTSDDERYCRSDVAMDTLPANDMFMYISSQILHVVHLAVISQHFISLTNLQ
jgi:hypothetical protein